MREDGGSRRIEKKGEGRSQLQPDLRSKEQEMFEGSCIQSRGVVERLGHDLMWGRAGQGSPSAQNQPCGESQMPPSDPSSPNITGPKN